MSNFTECIKITRADGGVVGMTALDEDVVVGGVTYRSLSGYTPSAIDQNRDLSVSNLDVQGLLDAGHILETDLLGGAYDNARVHIFGYDYVAGSVTDADLFNGYLGSVVIKSGAFSAEIRSFHQLLKADLTQKYSPTCRAEFGDSRCRKPLGPYTTGGTVTSTSDRSNFADSSKTHAAGTFKYGVLTWTSGANNGQTTAVAEFSATAFRLFIPANKNIAIGDSFIVIAGCDKLFSTCRDAYANTVNFRGEPSLPGRDKILEYPDAK